MNNTRILIAFLLFASAPFTGAATFTEDFSSDPARDGWRIFGDTNLFHWNNTNQNLEVTWDSSQSNSFFYHPLGTTLSKDDDFQISFDLMFYDIQSGVNPNKPDPLEVGIGLLNFGQASQSGYVRGLVSNAVNVAEFDYFPYAVDPVYGPILETVSPTFISTNFTFAYAFDNLVMTNNDVFHIHMAYTASNQTLITTMTLLTPTNEPFGPVDNVVLTDFSTFTDFRVDTFSIDSYSDIGDNYDSLLAHGVVDNLSITIPPPPVSIITGGSAKGSYEVQFTSRTNWLYTLERTTDFRSWVNATADTPGANGTLILSDTNAPAGRAFYRVRATRP